MGFLGRLYDDLGARAGDGTAVAQRGMNEMHSTERVNGTAVACKVKFEQTLNTLHLDIFTNDEREIMRD